MKTLSKSTILISACLFALANCSPNEQTEVGHSLLEPSEVIDLGALVTEDLPERVWGKANLAAHEFTRPNAFDVIEWDGDGMFTGEEMDER